MTINEKTDIKKLLTEISDLTIPVRISINGSRPVDDCRLIINNEGELLVQVPSGAYPDTGEVELTCAHPKGIYTFKSSILSMKDIGLEDAVYFKIDSPYTITTDEKRKFYRVRPSDSNPIQIRMALPDSDTINVQLMDIGGGGVSFAVPKNLNAFQIGDALYLDLHLPMYNWISALVIVRNLTMQKDAARIGVEFSRVSEDAYKTIMHYVAAKISARD